MAKDYILTTKTIGMAEKLRQINPPSRYAPPTRSRKYFLHNTASNFTLKAGVYYSIPLYFDIPRGYYDNDNVYQDSDASKLFYQPKSETFSSFYSPYNQLIDAILSGSSLVLRPVKIYNSEEDLKKERLAVAEGLNLSNKSDHIASSPRSIIGSFYPLTDILPGDIGPIVFNADVTPALCYDDPLTQYDKPANPFYLNERGAVSYYRHDNGVTACSLFPCYVAGNTLRDFERASDASYKVVACLEPPEKLSGANTLDYRSLLVDNTTDERRFFDPFTDTAVKTRALLNSGESRAIPQSYALPCLVVRESYRAPSTKRGEFLFYPKTNDNASNLPICELVGVLSDTPIQYDGEFYLPVFKGDISNLSASYDHIADYKPKIVRLVSTNERRDLRGGSSTIPGSSDIYSKRYTVKPFTDHSYILPLSITPLSDQGATLLSLDFTPIPAGSSASPVYQVANRDSWSLGSSKLYYCMNIGEYNATVGEVSGGGGGGTEKSLTMLTGLTAYDNYFTFNSRTVTVYGP